MILTAREYLTGGYFMDDKPIYCIHYRTWKQTKSKFRAFTTLDEAIRWAKRQRGKVIPEMGAWQILAILDGDKLEVEE